MSATIILHIKSNLLISEIKLVIG